MANILFDFDGVLVRSRYPDRSFLWQGTMEKDLGITPEIRNDLFARPGWIEILQGRRDFRETIAEVFHRRGLSLTVEDFVSYWLARDMNWRSDVLDLAIDLKQAGHRLFIATNQDHIRLADIRRQEKVRGLFVDVLASADLGEVKPERAFFQKCRAHAGHNPSLLIDDDAKNVDVAIQEGLHGILFQPDAEGGHTVEWLRARLENTLS
jgi:putative hydrolase of the HAD superfamily